MAKLIKPKALRKIQDRLMSRGSVSMNQKIGDVVLESRVDYRGKDNAGMTVIRNARTKPKKFRLNGWTFQGTRKSYGPKTVNYSKTTMFAPIGSGL